MQGCDLPMTAAEEASIEGEGLILFPSRVPSIRITACLNGYIIRVGCQTLVMADKDFMLKELGRYLDNPQAVEQEYMSKVNPPPAPNPQ